MTALRQEAINLIETIPEKDLAFFVDCMKIYNKNFIDINEIEKNKKNLMLDIMQSGVNCQKSKVKENIEDKNEIEIGDDDPFLKALRTRKFVKKTGINVEEYMREIRDDRF